MWSTITGRLFLILLVSQKMTKIVQSCMRFSKSSDNKYFDRSLPETETALNEIDFENGRRVASIDSANDNIDYSKMYNKNLFEGDIADPSLLNIIKSRFMSPSAGGSDDFARNAIRHKHRIWPNGYVPYAISTHFTPNSRSLIAAAIDEFHRKTCIKFIPKSSSSFGRNYVLIKFGNDGCWSSHIGQSEDGGVQDVVLEPRCLHVGAIIHELMHVVGFYHEQSRADRDYYIDIIWGNIMNGMEGQFEKHNLGEITHLGTKYDYESIMHYPSNAFSKNDRDTIVPKQHGARIGQQRGFSHNDIVKINKLYNCDEPDSDEMPIDRGGPNSDETIVTGDVESKSKEEEETIDTNNALYRCSRRLVCNDCNTASYCQVCNNCNICHNCNVCNNCNACHNCNICIGCNHWR